MGADPATLALTTMAVSAVVGAGAAYQGSQASKAAASYEAGVEEQNAALAEREAQDALARGRVEAGAFQRRLAQIKGSQAAQIAATGADIGGGSALDLQADTALLGDLDLLAVRQNAEREAYAARVGATGARSRARLSSFQARTTSPALAGGTSLLSSGSQYASAWYAANAGK